MKTLITAEHAGWHVPKKYESLFKGAYHDLRSHRGYDIGSLDLFQTLCTEADFSKKNEITRLLIEFNRSVHHRNLFSIYSKSLSPSEKNELITKLYQPYRTDLVDYIQSAIKSGENILHLSVHSFTPSLNGIERNADVSFLYDPARKSEQVFAAKWKASISAINPKLKMRYNYPYLGKADGLTTFLRKVFPGNYIGIELEVNQKFIVKGRFPALLKKQLSQAFRATKREC